MVGLYKRPAETAATLDGDGWLHAGNIGTLDDRGYLRITGRLQDMVVCGGENTYLHEVEAVLTQRPAVAAAVVVGLADEA